MDLDGASGIKKACKETALGVPDSGFKRGRKKTPHITLPQEAADKHATDKRKCKKICKGWCLYSGQNEYKYNTRMCKESMYVD